MKNSKNRELNKLAANSNRVLKNSLFLNLRMILVMAVSLYTAKVTIDILGIVDFGIYNVVGGVIGLLAILNGAMVSASQRFLSFELGKNESGNFSQVFNSLLLIFAFVALLTVIIGLCIKNWVIYDFLVIPFEKRNAANYIYIYTLISFSINVITIPFMASIISHEKMVIYGYVGIIEALLKLLVVFLLYYLYFDKLILYGFLNLVVIIIISIIYIYYCFRSFDKCQLFFFYDKKLFKRLMGFMGWNLFGSLTGVLNVQGQSIMLNLFFGPALNGAKSISDKIYSIIASFSSNIFTAIRPQIVKKYSIGDKESMFDLVMISSKLAFFLIFLIVVPLIINMEFLLKLWLGPITLNENIIYFSQLSLIYSLINVFEQPISSMIQATGNIKFYQLSVGVTTLMFLPVLYLLFKMGFPAPYSMVLLILIYAVALIIRLFVSRKQLDFPVMIYLKSCLFPIVLVTLITCFFIVLLITYLSNSGIIDIIKNIVLIECIMFVLIYFFGLHRFEKSWIKEFVYKRFVR